MEQELAAVFAFLDTSGFWPRACRGPGRLGCRRLIAGLLGAGSIRWSRLPDGLLRLLKDLRGYKGLSLPWHHGPLFARPDSRAALLVATVDVGARIDRVDQDLLDRCALSRTNSTLPNPLIWEPFPQPIPNFSLKQDVQRSALLWWVAPHSVHVLSLASCSLLYSAICSSSYSRAA